MPSNIPTWLTLHPEVSRALASQRPVVALESTVITHGLPRPQNLELARSMEAEIRSSGATPATAAVLRGRARLGLSAEELESLSNDEFAVKISRRDFGAVCARGLSGGTTVAGTMILAHAAGVPVFATGGIGGIHRGDGFDVSADLPELGCTPIAVVCAGIKSILDLPHTLERLETDGVPVIGWKTDQFPAFFSRESGLQLDMHVDDAFDAAEVLRAQWELGLKAGALICVPCPAEDALPMDFVETAILQAEAEAERQHIRGKALTPFLLAKLAELTDGATLRANLSLLLNNARVAADIACALAEQR
ncbi:MAG: pseudouridine-5'-phosphate glycosidase [Anaerolineales bacterium]|nr:pseudouridine-5'-phosphate glycosidase [Anaerolineales bacterium]